MSVPPSRKSLVDEKAINAAIKPTDAASPKLKSGDHIGFNVRVVDSMLSVELLSRSAMV